MGRRGWFIACACFAGSACQAHAVVEPPDAQDDSGAGDDAGPGPDAPTTSPTTSSATSQDAASTGPANGTTSADEDSSGEAGTTTAATGLPPGTCGDGIQDPTEGCDLSYENNRDDGPCTQSCQQAFCGDGLIWQGQEGCDAGPANNDLTYNGCREDCVPGPSCGDGAVQPEEECDPTVPPEEVVAGCTMACRFDARLAFVTASSHSAQLGGLAGADAICVAAATAAGLDRASSFLAWLSDGVDGPKQRFKNAAADPKKPYARRDGKLLASSFQALITSGIQYTLDLDELGDPLAPETLVWTATDADGLPYNENACLLWTTTTFKESVLVGLASPSLEEGAYGMWKAANHWTRFAFYPCKKDDVHLYCFED